MSLEDYCRFIIPFFLEYFTRPFEEYLEDNLVKMVPFYGTVYKSRIYDLIIPLPAYESGAEREKRRAVVFVSGKTKKSE